MPTLTHFDHVTVVVHDLERATRAYERLLGVAPHWRGEHPELGTSAALFGLYNTVIELVAPRANAPEAEGLRQLLAARGEGLHAIAFGTADAAACSKLLRERNVRATPPEAGEARGNDGQVRHYRAVELSARSTRGVAVLVVERADFSALLAGSRPAPECVEALDHVVIRTSDPEAARNLYEAGCGIRLALDRKGPPRMLFFRIGKVTLEIVELATLGGSDELYGVAYRVRDIDAAHDRLLEQGFDVDDVRDGAKPGTRVFAVRSGTCGVPTLVIRDPAREDAG